MIMMPMEQVFQDGNACNICGEHFSPHALNWSAEETSEKLCAYVGEAVIRMARINKRLGTAYQQKQITAKEFLESEEFNLAKQEVASRLEIILAADDGDDDACLQSNDPFRSDRNCSQNDFACP